MSEALETAYPATTLQTCLVHLIRNSLDFVGLERAQSARRRAAARSTRRPPPRPLARRSEAFAAGPWGRPLPDDRSRRGASAWAHVIPFFAFPPEVRRVIYTTNALESVHARVRKIIKTRGHFPERRGGHETDLAGAAAVLRSDTGASVCNPSRLRRGFGGQGVPARPP